MPLINPIALKSAHAGVRSERALDIIEAIGNTPLFDLPNISKEVAPVRIMGKAEFYNPGGSVKDRPALNMILDGEKRAASRTTKFSWTPPPAIRGLPTP